MLRIRRIEEAIADEYKKQEMRCPTHLCIGQEAIASGICHHLDVSDKVFSGHRAHGHYLAKGGSLNAFIAELYGCATGCSKGYGGSMHLTDPGAGFVGSTPIVAGTIPLAVGSAWRAKLLQEKDITVVFFGDGCFEEGVLHESMNFAKLHAVPVLFVCENNLYSVYTQLKERQPDRKIHAIAEAHGLTVFSGDGNDINVVSDIAEQSVAQLRNDQGPIFLELDTYRWLEHCGPYDDDHLDYRPEGELAAWKKKCPLKKTLAELQQVVQDEILEKIEQDIQAEISQAFSAAKKCPVPSAERKNEQAHYA